MAIGVDAGFIDGIDLGESAGASFMDPRLYTSAAVFDLDMTQIIPSSWVMVGDTSRLEQPGSYVTENIGSEPVLVVRGDDGRLRAFSNVCPHRASIVLEGEGDCGQRFSCPYHGWVFDTTGALRGIPHRDGFAEPPDPDELGLRELPLAIWERFVFVNPSGTAPPLEEYLGDLPRLVRSHRIADQQPVFSYKHQAKANWKLLVDNGYCDYHVPVVHSRLMPLIEGLGTWQQQADRYINILRAPLTELGLADQPLLDSIEADEELVTELGSLTLAIGLYPNVLLLAFRTGAVHVISWWPQTPDLTEVRVQTYDHRVPDDEDMRYGSESVERLQQEDIRVCELVQRGLASAHYRPGPRHYLESRVAGFQRTYHEELVRGITLETPVEG